MGRPEKRFWGVFVLGATFGATLAGLLLAPRSPFNRLLHFRPSGLRLRMRERPAAAPPKAPRKRASRPRAKT